MTAKPQDIEQYLQDSLGLDVSLSKWKGGDRFPLFLRSGYGYFQTDILGTPCLLMIDRDREVSAPASVSKHLDQVEKKWSGEIIYVREQLASHQRKRLIEQKVPFLVPGNQLYLPMLGIDLREHFRAVRQAPQELSPATQALVLRLVLHQEKAECTPAEMAARLGYSKMTMTRAFDEVEAAQLCDVSKEGRERWLRVKGTRHEQWQKSLPLMRSPVKQRKHIQWSDRQQVGPIAGYSALAQVSRLAAPATPIFAVSQNRWKELHEKTPILPIDADDPDAVEIEIWRYDPLLLAEEVVDRLSLFLSLKDDTDERVEAALEEMMEAIPW